MQCLINVCLHSHFQLSTKLGESHKEGKKLQIGSNPTYSGHLFSSHS